jgi:hypothetical protein
MEYRKSNLLSAKNSNIYDYVASIESFSMEIDASGAIGACFPVPGSLGPIFQFLSPISSIAFSNNSNAFAG